MDIWGRVKKATDERPKGEIDMNDYKIINTRQASNDKDVLTLTREAVVVCMLKEVIDIPARQRGQIDLALPRDIMVSHIGISTFNKTGATFRIQGSYFPDGVDIPLGFSMHEVNQTKRTSYLSFDFQGGSEDSQITRIDLYEIRLTLPDNKGILNTEDYHYLLSRDQDIKYKMILMYEFTGPTLVSIVPFVVKEPLGRKVEVSKIVVRSECLCWLTGKYRAVIYPGKDTKIFFTDPLYTDTLELTFQTSNIPCRITKIAVYESQPCLGNHVLSNVEDYKYLEWKLKNTG